MRMASPECGYHIRLCVGQHRVELAVPGNAGVEVRFGLGNHHQYGLQ